MSSDRGVIQMIRTVIGWGTRQSKLVSDALHALSEERRRNAEATEKLLGELTKRCGISDDRSGNENRNGP